MRIHLLADDLTKIDTAYPFMKHFIRKTGEPDASIINDQNSIPDCRKRWRQGKRIAISFVEATANVLISKRFVKSQQIQRSKQGIHDLSQIRARTLDGTLDTIFEKGIRASPPTTKYLKSERRSIISHRLACSLVISIQLRLS